MAGDKDLSDNAVRETTQAISSKSLLDSLPSPQHESAQPGTASGMAAVVETGYRAWKYVSGSIPFHTQKKAPEQKAGKKNVMNLRRPAAESHAPIAKHRPAQEATAKITKPKPKAKSKAASSHAKLDLGLRPFKRNPFSDALTKEEMKLTVPHIHKVHQEHLDGVRKIQRMQMKEVELAFNHAVERINRTVRDLASKRKIGLIKPQDAQSQYAAQVTEWNNCLSIAINAERDAVQTFEHRQKSIEADYNKAKTALLNQWTAQNDSFYIESEAQDETDRFTFRELVSDELPHLHLPYHRGIPPSFLAGQISLFPSTTTKSVVLLNPITALDRYRNPTSQGVSPIDDDDWDYDDDDDLAIGLRRAREKSRERKLAAVPVSDKAPAVNEGLPSMTDLGKNFGQTMDMFTGSNEGKRRNPFDNPKIRAAADSE